MCAVHPGNCWETCGTTRKVLSSTTRIGWLQPQRAHHHELDASAPLESDFASTRTSGRQPLMRRRSTSSAWVAAVGVGSCCSSPVRIAGAAVDNVPDNLGAFVDLPSTLRTRSTVGAYLRRPIRDRRPIVRPRHSTRALLLPVVDRKPPDADRRQPPSCNALRGQLGVVVKNTGASDHVLSNSDIDVARTSSTSCWVPSLRSTPAPVTTPSRPPLEPDIAPPMSGIRRRR